MPTTAPIDDVMAVLGLPIAFAATGLGIGLFVERVLRTNVPNGLLIPVGACGLIVLSLAVYSTGLGDVPAVAITVVLTVAGGVLAKGGLRARLRIGWTGAAGLGAYLLFILPELCTGHWTWSGYNFVNDSATQMLLAAYVKVHGTVSVGLWPPRSTTTEFVRGYLTTSYPLGTHADLATLSGLLHTDPAVLYQGYLASLAGMTAMSLTMLAAGFLGLRRAALASSVAAGAALTYQYALQGSIKELGTMATCITAVAIACHVIRRGVDIRGGLLAALPLAALFDVYYAAALPFMGAVALVAVGALFFVRRGWPDLRIVAALTLSLIATVGLAIPAVNSVANSYQVLSTGFRSGSPGAVNLGQLARALPLSEVSGVWLGGDYRYKILAEPAGVLTAAATAFILALALFGAVRASRSGQIEPVVLLLTMGLVLVLVLPRVSAYAGAKTLAIASPTVVLAAFVGASGLRERRRAPNWRTIGLKVLATGAATGVALAVVASDAVAYNYDYVAPTPRMIAIEQVAKRFAGRRLILWNEFEEFAKYFARDARINAPTEALTVRQVQLLYFGGLYGKYYDLDRDELSFVESFPVIVMRRSPSASRPPTNYRLVYTNSYFEAWIREPLPHVLLHLPEQSVYSASARVQCAGARGLVARAPRGSHLIVAIHPYVTTFSPLIVLHPPNWPIDGTHPEALTIVGAGVVAGKLQVPRAGRYELWVQGNLPGGVSVLLDGNPAGTALGVNTPNQWYPVAAVELAPGTHYIVVRQDVDYLRPGDGGSAWLGPVALSAQSPERLVSVPTARWRSVCGRSVDWVELVRP